jgi:hypothetical protein
MPKRNTAQTNSRMAEAGEYGERHAAGAGATYIFPGVGLDTGRLRQMRGLKSSTRALPEFR